MDGIPNHLYALLQSGPGNDCGIRKEQQLIISGNLHATTEMCQKSFLWQQSVFPCQNGMKQIIRIDNTLHQNIAPPSRTMRTASRAASSLSSICNVCTYSGYFFKVGYFSKMAESPIIRNSAMPSSKAPGYGIFSIGVLAQTTAMRFLLFKVLR